MARVQRSSGFSDRHEVRSGNDMEMTHGQCENLSHIKLFMPLHGLNLQMTPFWMQSCKVFSRSSCSVLDCMNGNLAILKPL